MTSMTDVVGIREMWPGGPLRQFSVTSVPNWTPCASGGYVGQYLCKRCETAAPKGVYDPEWLCGPCNAQFTAKTGFIGHPTQRLDTAKAGIAV